MKFCTHCGSQIHDEAVLCVHCGCPVNQSAFQQQNVLQAQQLNVKKKPSVSAIISFILSILSFILIYLYETVLGFLAYFSPITAIVSLVLGIVSLVKIKRKNLWGKGFSISAIIISSFFIIIFAIGFILGIMIAMGLVSPEIPEFPGNNVTSLLFNLF